MAAAAAVADDDVDDWGSDNDWDDAPADDVDDWGDADPDDDKAGEWDDDAWDDDGGYDHESSTACRTAEGDVKTAKSVAKLVAVAKLWVSNASTTQLLKDGEIEVSFTTPGYERLQVSVVHADVGAVIFPLMIDADNKCFTAFCESCTKSTIDVDEVSAELATWIFGERRSVFSILDHTVRLVSRLGSTLRKAKVAAHSQKKTRANAQELPYVLCDRDELADLQMQMINETAEHMRVSRSLAACLLIHLSWDDVALRKQWGDVLRQKELCEEANCLLALDPARESAMRRKMASLVALGNEEKEGDVLCEICYGDFPPSRMVNCCTDDDHLFCYPCFKAHCESLVSDTGKESVWFSNHCPSCEERIGFEVFEAVLSPALLKKYKNVFELSFEERSDNVTYCPTVQCGHVVVYETPEQDKDNVLQVGKCSILCKCNHWFCFECHGKAHAPAKCEHWKDWAKRDIGEEGLTAMAIKKSTKPCPNPKCGAYVEKNGGCMFMTCSACKQPFCWACGQWGKGVHHVWECNQPPTKQWSDGTVSKDQANEKRYQFYYERYWNHKDSLRIAGDQLKATTQKIRKELGIKPAPKPSKSKGKGRARKGSLFDIFKKKKKGKDKAAAAAAAAAAGATTTKRRCVRGSVMSANEAEFILKAVKLVHRCRHVLAMTYVKQFYLKKDDLLFMDMQAQLEKYTDHLHGYIDKYSVKDLCAPTKRKAIINCCDSIGGFLRSVEEYRKVNAKQAKFQSEMALFASDQRRGSGKSKAGSMSPGMKVLMEMQMPFDLSQKALEMCNGDANKAVQLILSGALGDAI